MLFKRVTSCCLRGLHHAIFQGHTRLHWIMLVKIPTLTGIKYSPYRNNINKCVIRFPTYNRYAYILQRLLLCLMDVQFFHFPLLFFLHCLTCSHIMTLKLVCKRQHFQFKTAVYRIRISHWKFHGDFQKPIPINRCCYFKGCEWLGVEIRHRGCKYFTMEMSVSLAE